MHFTNIYTNINCILSIKSKTHEYIFILRYCTAVEFVIYTREIFGSISSSLRCFTQQL